MFYADFEEFLTNELNVWKNADRQLQGWKISIYLYSIHSLYPPQTQTRKQRKNTFEI